MAMSDASSTAVAEPDGIVSSDCSAAFFAFSKRVAVPSLIIVALATYAMVRRVDLIASGQLLAGAGQELGVPPELLFYTAVGCAGVGLAAVQLAQRAGAEIYGTAGSTAKRQYLVEQGLAVGAA